MDDTKPDEIEFPWEREAAWMKIESAIRDSPNRNFEEAIGCARGAFDIVWFEGRPRDSTFNSFLSSHLTSVIKEMMLRDFRILTLERQLRREGIEPEA